MRRFDYKCPKCGLIQFDIITPTEVEFVDVQCPYDGAACSRQPAAPAFKVNGFNAANKYSKDQK